MTTSLCKITGTIIFTIFYDAKDKYTIARFRYHNSKGLCTNVIGFDLPHPIGQIMELKCTRYSHPKYITQFQVEEYQVLVPASTNAIYEYLCSRIFKGIGHNLVRRILDKFGDKAFDIILKDIDRLKEVEGVGQKAIDNIKNGLERRKIIRKVPKVDQKVQSQTNVEYRFSLS